jgi:iron complex outermembrane receptor protein
MNARSTWLLMTTALMLTGATAAAAQNAPPSGANGPATRGPSPAQNLTAQQPASKTGIEEVVVTAQKRSENVEKVPLSIVALSGAQLEKSGTNSVMDLQKVVPSFQLFTIAQSAGVTFLVRGFGTSSNAAIDPDVAAYIDGIYIPRPGAVLSSFLDINNVEVLRGPQGTLFGRNATVGAIELSSNAPSFSGFSGSGSAEVASYDTYKGQAVVNMPVTDTFALRGRSRSTTPEASSATPMTTPLTVETTPRPDGLAQNGRSRRTSPGSAGSTPPPQRATATTTRSWFWIPPPRRS